MLDTLFEVALECIEGDLIDREFGFLGWQTVFLSPGACVTGELVVNSLLQCIWEEMPYKLVISGVRDYWVYLNAIIECNAANNYLWTASDSLGSLVRIHALSGVQYDDEDSLS